MAESALLRRSARESASDEISSNADASLDRSSSPPSPIALSFPVMSATPCLTRSAARAIDAPSCRGLTCARDGRGLARYVDRITQQKSVHRGLLRVARGLLASRKQVVSYVQLCGGPFERDVQTL